VRLDQIRFQQVLINLLTNALKFSNNGSIIYIENKVENLSEDSPEVKITVNVKDQGIGISPSDQ